MLSGDHLLIKNNVFSTALISSSFCSIHFFRDARNSASFAKRNSFGDKLLSKPSLIAIRAKGGLSFPISSSSIGSARALSFESWDATMEARAFASWTRFWCSVRFSLRLKPLVWALHVLTGQKNRGASWECWWRRRSDSFLKPGTLQSSVVHLWMRWLLSIDWQCGSQPVDWHKSKYNSLHGISLLLACLVRYACSGKRRVVRFWILITIDSFRC